jgi:hypothetical protein
MILRGKEAPQSVERLVRALLALLGGGTCFLAVLSILYLLLFRQPTPMLLAGLELAIAPLAFAVVEFVRPARSGKHLERNRRPE